VGGWAGAEAGAGTEVLGARTQTERECLTGLGNNQKD